MEGLERRLTLVSVVAISISSMLGSGIFVLPGVAVSITGPALWLAYLIAGISVLPAALSKAELATAMPNSGGTYVYIERTFGPFAGTITGLGLWLSLLFKSAFALLGVQAYLLTFSSFSPDGIMYSLLLLIILMNILGVGKISKVMVVVVSISIVALLFLGGYGLSSLEPVNLKPFAPHGLDSVFSGAALVFVSYAGVTKVAAIAGEIKSPEKNLPKGILLSLFIVTILYCFMSFVYVGNIPFTSINNDIKPIFTLAQSVTSSTTIALVFSAVAILTMVSMANAGLLAASRFPFAMSRDLLLPSSLGRLSERFMTPTVSILLSGVIMATTLYSLDVAKIAKLASAFLLIIYMLENLAVIVLREMRVQWYKPSFKSPIYPGVQILGVLLTVFLLFMMGFIVLTAIALISVPGILIFVFYSRHKMSRRGIVSVKGIRRDLVLEPSEVGEFQAELLDEANVVVALFGNERAPEMLAELAVALDTRGEVEVVHLTEIPEQTGLGDIVKLPAYVCSIRRRMKVLSEKEGVKIHFDPVISHDIFKTISNISRQLHCSWLIKEWGGKTNGAFTINNHMRWLEDHLSCNLITFRDAGVRYIRKVFVYTCQSNAEHLSLITADHLANVYGAEVTLGVFCMKHASPEFVESQKEFLRGIASSFTAPVQFKVLEGKDEVSAVVTESASYDMLVLRDKTRDSLYLKFFGSDQDKIIEKATCSVISIRGVNDRDLVGDQ